MEGDGCAALRELDGWSARKAGNLGEEGREASGEPVFRPAEPTRRNLDVLLGRKVDAACTLPAVSVEEEREEAAEEGDGSGDEAGKEVGVLDEPLRVAEVARVLLDLRKKSSAAMARTKRGERTGCSRVPPRTDPTIPPIPQSNPKIVYAVDLLVSSVTSCTALLATPTAPLNRPIASRVQMAVPRFFDVPKSMTVQPVPTREAKRTALRPCFSATDTQIMAVKNCERKLRDLASVPVLSDCRARGTHKTAETTPVHRLTADSPPPFSPTPKLSTMLRVSENQPYTSGKRDEHARTRRGRARRHWLTGTPRACRSRARESGFSGEALRRWVPSRYLHRHLRLHLPQLRRKPHLARAGRVLSRSAARACRSRLISATAPPQTTVFSHAGEHPDVSASSFRPSQPPKSRSSLLRRRPPWLSTAPRPPLRPRQPARNPSLKVLDGRDFAAV